MSEVLLQMIDKFASEAGTKSVHLQKGQTMIEVDQNHLRRFITRIVKEAFVQHLSTITGLDLGQSIGIVYHFWRDRDTIHVKTLISKTEPTTFSVVDILPGAILYEMEIHDMFGVYFTGNPWMDRKLLLPDTWPADLPPPLLKSSKPAEIRKRLGLEAERQ